jgi:predicted porin
VKAIKSSRGQVLASISLLCLLSTNIQAADVKLYSSIRLSLQSADKDKGLKSDIVDNASRIGLQGEQVMNNDLTAIGRFEIGIDSSEGQFGGKTNNRLSYLGLEGDFGGLYIGNQWSPYYLTTGIATDNFNVIGAKHTHNVGRLSNMLKYSGTFGSASIESALIINDNSTPATNSFAVNPQTGKIEALSTPAVKDKDNIDRLQIAASFQAQRVKVGISLDKLSNSGIKHSAGSALGLSARYQDTNTTIALSFHNTDKELLDNQWSGKQALKQIEIYSGYNFGNTHTLHMAYGQSDDGTRTPSTFSFGYQNKLDPKTRFWAEAEYTDTKLGGKDKIKTIAIGLRYDWDYSENK